MRQTITTYLLMAIVLACPYFCVGEASPAAPEQSALPSCCCSHPSDQSTPDSPGSDHQAPDSPAPDSPNGSTEHDCFCQGALLGLAVRSAENAGQMELMLDSVATADLLSASSESSNLDEPNAVFAISTGRDIRALTCVFLL